MRKRPLHRVPKVTHQSPRNRHIREHAACHIERQCDELFCSIHGTRWAVSDYTGCPKGKDNINE
jgi:hypothetical protein